MVRRSLFIKPICFLPRNKGSSIILFEIFLISKIWMEPVGLTKKKKFLINDIVLIRGNTFLFLLYRAMPGAPETTYAMEDSRYPDATQGDK